jgi:O-antigen/teichoic acid export membrane protein
LEEKLAASKMLQKKPVSWSGMNFKVFGKNTLIYAIGNVGGRMGAFLLIPLYTHSLSLRDFGLLSTLLITIQMMTFVMSLGTYKGFIRFANDYESKNLMGQLLGSALGTTMIGAFLVMGISFVFLLPLFRSLLHTNEVHGYVILTCLAALFQSLYTHMTTYYRVKQEGLKFIITNLTSLMLLIATNLVFLRFFEQGVKGVLVAQVVTYGSLWLLLHANLISNTGLGFSFALARRLVWFSFPMLPAMLWDLVMGTSAVYFLGYFGSLEQVAIYSLGYKIVQIVYIALILPFQLAYEPLVYGNLNDPGIKITIPKLLTYLMLVYAFAALSIIFVLRALLPIIAPRNYFSTYTVVFLMLPGIAFIGVYYVAESLLGIRNKTSLIGGLVTLLTIGSIALNYFLIPPWGMYGAIFVFNVTIILTALILMVLGIKVFPIHLEGKRLGVIGALYLFFSLFVYGLRGVPPYIYYSVIPMTVLIIMGFLYRGSFFNYREKEILKNLLQGERPKTSSKEIAVH